MFLRLKYFLHGEFFRGYFTYNPAVTSLVILFLTTCILYFIKPFWFSAIPGPYALILSVGIAAIAVLAYCLTYTLFRPFFWKSWTNLLESAMHITTLLVMWPLIYLYITYCMDYLFPVKLGANINYALPDSFLSESFFKIVVLAALIYSLIRLGAFFFVHKVLNKRNDMAGQLNLKQKSKSAAIELMGKNKKEELKIAKEQLICIKSSGHYANIYYLSDDNDKLVNKMFRTSLKNLEFQTAKHAFLYRCHNSYIVNKEFLVNIRGNLNQSHAILKHYPKKVPISKSKIKYMKTLIEV